MGGWRCGRGASVWRIGGFFGGTGGGAIGGCGGVMGTGRAGAEDGGRGHDVEAAGGGGGRVAGRAERDRADRVAVDQVTGVAGELGGAVRRGQVAVGLGLGGGGDRQGARVDGQGAVVVGDRVVAARAGAEHGGRGHDVEAAGGGGGRVAGRAERDRPDRVAVDQVTGVAGELGGAVRREQVAVGLRLVVGGDRQQLRRYRQRAGVVGDRVAAETGADRVACADRVGRARRRDGCRGGRTCAGQPDARDVVAVDEAARGELRTEEGVRRAVLLAEAVRGDLQRLLRDRE